LTVHIGNDPRIDPEREILPRIRDLLAKQFGITHITIQAELTPCWQAAPTAHFVSAAQYPDLRGQAGKSNEGRHDHHEGVSGEEPGH
ncbi:MAG: hypothetical protein ACREYA_14820, partial [Cupriavidus necator]